MSNKDPQFSALREVLDKSRQKFREVPSEEAYAQQERSLAGETLPAREATKEELSELISTPRGKLKLALSMEVPVRCGGCHYLPDGTMVIMIGGKWLTGKEHDQLRADQRTSRALELPELDKLTDEEIEIKYPRRQG